MMASPVALPEWLLARLSAKIAADTGLDFPRERWADLERNVNRAAREWGSRDPLHFIETYVNNCAPAPAIDILIDHLTVSETYFFRDQVSFELIQTHVLPNLGKSHLRV